MSSIPMTPRLALPLLAASQAQKEVSHNEALTLIDAAVHPAVIAGDIGTPPLFADPGQCWIVAPSATGLWAGRDGSIAVMTDGGWRFIAPFDGLSVWLDGHRTIFRDGIWQDAPAIADPSGGATVDAEARAAIAALISALEAAGWVATP